MTLHSDSFIRRSIATILVSLAFVFLYEVTIRDSRSAVAEAPLIESGRLSAGTQLSFIATAYCKGQTTASGVAVRTGIAAADPTVLPVGTVVRVETPSARHSGIWTVMDTGPAVQGRTIDLYVWSCYEALEFGRRPVRLTVLRLGWHPQSNGEGLVESLFRRPPTASRKPTARLQPSSGGEHHPD
jgi:3D (Asp-Asp-Asp) domain-containing protein